MLIRGFSRGYAATALATKPNFAFITKLRAEFPGLPVQKAKEALDRSGNDYASAVAWIQQSMAQEGSRKAAKLSHRQVSQGCVSLLERPGIGAALLEGLAARLANTALLLRPATAETVTQLDITEMLASPLLPHPDSKSLDEASRAIWSSIGAKNQESLQSTPVTVQEGIHDAIGRLGENIKLRRGFLVTPKGATSNSVNWMASFVHGSAASSSSIKNGSIAAVVSLSAHFKTQKSGQIPDDLQAFGRQLAQHVVGMNPENISVLMQQPFLFDAEKSVQEVMDGALSKHSDLLDDFSVDFITRMALGEDFE